MQARGHVIAIFPIVDIPMEIGVLQGDSMLGPWTLLEWLALAERELLVFAGVFFLVGALDEFAVDLIWFWCRITHLSPTLH